jgi:hypothetical protein
MMIRGGALADREAADEVCGFRAHGIRSYCSHFLSLIQALSYSPP